MGGRRCDTAEHGTQRAAGGRLDVIQPAFIFHLVLLVCFFFFFQMFVGVTGKEKKTWSERGMVVRIFSVHCLYKGICETWLGCYRLYSSQFSFVVQWRWRIKLKILVFLKTFPHLHEIACLALCLQLPVETAAFFRHLPCLKENKNTAGQRAEPKPGQWLLVVTGLGVISVQLCAVTKSWSFVVVVFKGNFVFEHTLSKK